MDFTTLFSLHTLQSLLDLLGYPAVTLLILLESAGLPLPGESMVLLASFYAATSHQLQLPLIMLCAALGAIMGDNIGYLIGRTGGRRFVERFGKYFFLKTSHLEYAERFFARHGAKTVFFGRFITLLRIWAAFLAGMNQMPWRTFMFYNALGGITWAILIGSLGYFGGIFFQDHFDQVEQLVKLIGWGGLGAVILLAIGMLLFLRLRHARQQRQPANKESSNPSHAL
jgi:membrane protein DedA with SNARE-associated domain